MLIVLDSRQEDSHSSAQLTVHVMNLLTNHISPSPLHPMRRALRSVEVCAPIALSGASIGVLLNDIRQDRPFG